MQLLHQLLAEGMAPPHLLFMLTRQLRLMVQAKELRERRLSVRETQEQLGLSPSYPIDRLLKQCASYPMPRLVEVYQKLLETDIAIKTGKWKDELALDLLLAEVGS
jgi:DNA polymerase-3 subunit delta